MTRTLILASESTYRRALLDRLALPYRAIAHRCDERAFLADDSLEATALALATEKAKSLEDTHAASFIIGSDQIAEVDGEVLHKPGNRENAIGQLSRLAGREHRLLTALALRFPDGRVATALDVHVMHMRPLCPNEIERYIDMDSPLDCCGSYKIERLGISLFERIEGSDFTAIMGMPLLALTTMLRDAGFWVP